VLTPDAGAAVIADAHAAGPGSPAIAAKGPMTRQCLADCAKCEQPVIPWDGLRVNLVTNELGRLARRP
jgi:hypothetical protein